MLFPSIAASFFAGAITLVLIQVTLGYMFISLRWIDENDNFGD